MEKILVFFPDQEKLGTEGLNNIAIAMIQNNVSSAIVVIKGTTQITRRVSPRNSSHRNWTLWAPSTFSSFSSKSSLST